MSDSKNVSIAANFAKVDSVAPSLYEIYKVDKIVPALNNFVKKRVYKTIQKAQRNSDFPKQK